MIRVIEDDNTREYHNLSRTYGPNTLSDPGYYTLLVTYTVDGEPSAPLYMWSLRDLSDCLKFISDNEAGTVENIRVWTHSKTIEELKGFLT